MLIEQAIFTSAQSDHAVGYHLAARSPGLDERDARELSVWGPSHDSLESASAATAVSVNFFRLPSGAYCVSKTQLAGAEYSGRGLRTYTSCLVVPPPVLARFANNPFGLLRAAWAKGLLKVCDAVPSQLVPFQLAGRAAPVDEGLIGQLVEQCGANTIARLIEAVLGDKPVVLINVSKPEATVAGLLNLFPLSCRRELSFATGLKHSSRRPFHLLIAGEESAELRRLFRQQVITVVDVAPAVRAPRRSAKRVAGAEPEGSPDGSQRTGESVGGWAGYIADAVTRDALSLVFEQMRERQEGLHLENLNELGEHLRREIPSSGAAVRSRSEVRKRAAPSAPAASSGSDGRRDAPHNGNGASTTDDDFLAMLLSGQPHSPDDASQNGDALSLHDEPEGARQVHLERLPRHKAPSILIDVESPETLERLERLDDVVFDAMIGDERALDEMSRLWPQLMTELGTEKLEESREQYLRYALSIWEGCLDDGLRDHDRALASLQVLSVLFGDR